MYLFILSLILLCIGGVVFIAALLRPTGTQRQATIGSTMIVLGGMGLLGLGMFLAVAFVVVPVLLGGVIMAVSFLVPDWRRWPVLLGGAMIVVGTLGFMGQALSATGGLNWLPATWEWPMGTVEGVITTENGLHIAPTEAAGRVQVYDSQWRFQRGWHIGAGAFALRPLKGDEFEVLTARGNHRYVFNTAGELISTGTYPGEDYERLAHFGEPAVIATRWWLWPWTGPLAAWLIYAGGFGCVALACLGRRRATDGVTRAESPSQPQAGDGISRV